MTIRTGKIPSWPLLLLTIAFAGAASASAQTAPAVRKLTIQTYDGGSAVTELSYGIAVNKGSSLHRRWYVVNDSTCPVEIGNLGIKPRYDDRSYEFLAIGDLTSRTDLSALEVIFAQFDLWGNRDRNLSSTTVKDIPNSSTFKLSGSWYATESDVTRELTSVAYVRSAMTADGKIWRADLDKIVTVLQSVALKVSASGLEPEPRKDPAVK